MLARIRKSAENKDSGFTLIELLVVMIIIGILAAIAIPAFLSQKTKAKETSAKADATSVSQDIAAAIVDGNLASASYKSPDVTLTYATGGPAAVTLTPRLSAGNTIVSIGALGSAYCVEVKGDQGKSWTATDAGLVKNSACSAAGVATANP